MDFAAIQCVIDRQMTHACTSVATDGGKKILPVPADQLEENLACGSCPGLLFMSDSVLWGFRKTRQSAEKVSERAERSHILWTLPSIDETASVTGVCGTDSEIYIKE